MDIFKVIGSAALGVVVGLIARFFFERFDKFNPKALGSVLGCIVGGTGIEYLANWLEDPAALAIYPVGLLIGLFAYALIWQTKDQKKKDEPHANPPPKPAGSQPTFTLLEVTKTLRFQASDGSQAHLQRLVTMRANAKATDFWICTISADGSIENINVDASVGSSQRIDPNAGRLEIYLIFNSAVEAGENVDVRLEYDLVDSFTTANEYIGHEVQHETEKVSLVVEFPIDRPCISGEFHRKFAGDTNREKSVKRSQSGLRLEAEIKTPQLGEKYSLAWRW